MTKAALPSWVQAELQRVPQASEQGQLRQAQAVQAVAGRFDSRKKRVVVDMANGASFSFPPALAQGLADARPAELAVIEISPMGTGLHWPQLDADLSVEGLLTGVFGSRAWMREHAARAGRVTSPQKAIAARNNGVKGGRPRKAMAD